MVCNPSFTFFLSQENTPVQAGDLIWQQPLPMDRTCSRNKNGFRICYGDYFEAIRRFVEKNHFELVCLAVKKQTRLSIEPEEIEKILVYLEKHGEFYHPARIEISIRGRRIPFVLNVALSDAGNSCIKREFRTLERLNTDFPFSFIPRVYGYGDILITDRHNIMMFLGEWFEDYHEFHLSDQSNGDRKIKVWDSKGGLYLTFEQTKSLYRQAAKIMTCYYNTETFEQIFPWHHAAGDFILKPLNGSVDLKLITVRQYAPMIETTVIDGDALLEVMLIFLLNLSIRMRLDRLDGIGDMAWSDEIAVPGMLEGFFDGLTHKASLGENASQTAAHFKRFLLSCSESDLYDLSYDIVNAGNPRAPDLPIIKMHLKDHIALLHHTIHQI